MKPSYTDEQIARNYQLWQEYADPHGTMNQTEFDTLTISEKVSILVEMFGKPHAPGTPPDTSLHLGKKRRAWLKRQGGIQPTITRLIDDAMKLS